MLQDLLISPTILRNLAKIGLRWLGTFHNVHRRSTLRPPWVHPRSTLRPPYVHPRSTQGPPEMGDLPSSRVSQTLFPSYTSPLKVHPSSTRESSSLFRARQCLWELQSVPSRAVLSNCETLKTLPRLTKLLCSLATLPSSPAKA